MDHEHPLISVIVPIYMIDRYVGSCIESIIRQTYQNIEIILVDDGSKDRCAELCDLYALKDTRIKVVHKPNGGLVSARKAGLRESNGEFISYVDGDDWIEPGFIEGLYRAAIDSNADMVCAGQSRDLFNQSERFTNPLPVGVYEREKLQMLWQNMMSYGSFYRPGITTYVWNKLFRRTVLLEPQSEVDDRIALGEDAAVTYPALLKCHRVAIIHHTDYHYRQREDSMLKQSACFADEAQQLKYLYNHLMRWAAKEEHPKDKLRLAHQIVDYMLSICVIRSGGMLAGYDYSSFGNYGANVVIYSAGTFGQQLFRRLKESGTCHIAGWIDEDCWEYRRCCLNVDPVDSISEYQFDHVLIATVDNCIAEQLRNKLLTLGVKKEKILAVSAPVEYADKSILLSRFLDIDALRAEENRKKVEVCSHA